MHYEKRINDQRTQRDNLKSVMRSFDSQESLTLHDQTSGIVVRRKTKMSQQAQIKKALEEERLKSLQAKIFKLYSNVGAKSSEFSIDDGILQDDPLSQLREVEKSLLVMIETQDFIEQQSNPEMLRRYQEAERGADKARKQMRYEKKRREEVEMLLAR